MDHRNPVFERCSAALKVAALAALILLTAPVAFGQGAVPAVPEIPAVPPDEYVGSAEDAAFAVTLPAPGYWIVSTWSSPQSFTDTPPRFCPVVTRYDDCDGFRRSSYQELGQSLVPGIPVVIVVHGSFMDAPSICPESLDTLKWLRAGSRGLPFQMIYFSWPSDRKLSLIAAIDVAVLGSRASRNGFYLTSLIQHLPPECPVALIGHSHGTRLISSSLHLLAGGVVEDYRHSCGVSTGRRIRTVFTASAIDHDWLNPGQPFERALCSTECLLNVKNCADPALLIYPLRRIGSSRALGFSGFTSKDRRLLGAASAKVRDWDVSPEVGAVHLWPFYTHRPALARGMGDYIFFPDLQLTAVAASDEGAATSAEVTASH